MPDKLDLLQGTLDLMVLRTLFTLGRSGLPAGPCGRLRRNRNRCLPTPAVARAYLFFRPNRASTWMPLLASRATRAWPSPATARSPYGT